MTTPSTGRDLHIDVPLSNIVVNRRPDGFAADQILPITTVDKRSNLYYKFFHGLHRRHVLNRTQRAPGTAAKKVGYNVTSDAYYCDNFALGAEWPVEDEVGADAVLNWAQANANNVTDQLMTDYEVRVAELAVRTLSVGTVVTISSAWSDDTANAYRDILDKKEEFRQRTGMLPNLMILPEQVRSKLITNGQIRDLLFGDRGGVPTDSQLAGLFEMDKLVTPKSMVNTFSDDETVAGAFSFGNIWGPHVYMAHVRNLSGLETDTWINAFRWTSPLFGVPMAVRRWYDDKLRKYELDVNYYQVEKIVSSDLAVRIMNVIST